MRCSNCGNNIPDNMNFCNKCGAPVQRAATGQGARAAQGAGGVGVGVKVLLTILVLVVVAGVGTGTYFGVKKLAGGSRGQEAEREDREEDDDQKDDDKNDSDKDDDGAGGKDSEGDDKEGDESEETDWLPAEAQILEDYFVKELVGNYGVIESNKKTTIEYPYDDINKAMDRHNAWDTNRGMASHIIYDLDGDGHYEMLAIRYLDDEDKSIMAQAYRLSERNVKEWYNRRIMSYSVTGYSDYIFSFIPRNSNPCFMVHNHGVASIFADGEYSEIGIYDVKMEPVSILKQTDGGSDGFIYTAFSYDDKGNITDKKVVYDQYDGGSEADLQRGVERLFEEQNIKISQSGGTWPWNQDMEYFLQREEGAVNMLLHQARTTYRNSVTDLTIWVGMNHILPNGIKEHEAYKNDNVLRPTETLPGHDGGNAGGGSFGEVGIIFSASSSEYIDERQIAALSDEELRLAINEIYARNGYIFNNQDLLGYYRQYPWYQEVYTPNQFRIEYFNEYEYENVKRMEKERDRRKR